MYIIDSRAEMLPFDSTIALWIFWTVNVTRGVIHHQKNVGHEVLGRKMHKVGGPAEMM